MCTSATLPNCDKYSLRSSGDSKPSFLIFRTMSTRLAAWSRRAFKPLFMEPSPSGTVKARERDFGVAASGSTSPATGEVNTRGESPWLLPSASLELEARLAATDSLVVVEESVSWLLPSAWLESEERPAATDPPAVVEESVSSGPFARTVSRSCSKHCCCCTTRASRVNVAVWTATWRHFSASVSAEEGGGLAS